MKILLNLSRVILLTLTSMLIAQTASAICSTWGCAAVSQRSVPNGIIVKGYLDDNPGDRLCASIRYRMSTESWPGRTLAKSCGQNINFDIFLPRAPAGYRIYLDDGRYYPIGGITF